MERKIGTIKKNQPIMNNRYKNRKFSVFFIPKNLIAIMSILLLVGCKSKTDWRTKYNEEKTTTTKTVRKATTDAPKSIDDYAKMLDVSKGSLTNEYLYSFISNWYGTPYKFGGQSQQGVDCSGFTNILYREIYNVQLPRSSKDIAVNIKRKYTKNLKEGDLVFFSFGKSKEINHVGIYLHNNKFVHASTSKGVIISDLTEPWYGNYLVKCGTYQVED